MLRHGHMVIINGGCSIATFDYQRESLDVLERTGKCFIPWFLVLHSQRGNEQSVNHHAGVSQRIKPQGSPSFARSFCPVGCNNVLLTFGQNRGAGDWYTIYHHYLLYQGLVSSPPKKSNQWEFGTSMELVVAKKNPWYSLKQPEIAWYDVCSPSHHGNSL